MWKRVHQSRFGLARIEADQYWDQRWIPWSKALYPQQFRPIGRVGGRYEIPPQFPPLPLARRSERNGSAPISLVKPVERDHAGLRPGIVRPVEQAGLDPVGGDEIEDGDAGFLVAESGLKIIARPATAAAISFPVSAVATGRRIALEAVYWRSVGLNGLMWTRRQCWRSRGSADAFFPPPAT